MPKKIAYGDKMLKLGLKFWTDNLPPGEGDRTAWAKGAIYLYKNKSRKIKDDQILFNSMDEFFVKLDKLLRRNRIKLIEKI